MLSEYQVSDNMQFNNIQDEDEPLPAPPRRHFGRTLPFGRLENGQPRWMLGPHYYVFILTFLVSILLMYFLLSQITKILTLPWKIIMFCSCGCFLLSFLKIGFSVPGIASRADQPDETVRCNERYCRPCRIVRPMKTVHCLDCDVCIIGYDHHCPWIGKCVGDHNLSDFYCFLTMTFGNLIMMLVATVFGHQ